MWNPIKIEIYNLFAHKESVYEFKNNACTVIFGKNETDRGLKNNGAGKTTLFEAISIALTNESLRNINKESFINKDAEECKIVFHLFNPVLKMKLKIVRIFSRRKSVKIEIWENDVLNKQITSVNEANKRVFDLIGINRDDLIRYFIIGQDNHYTFFTASDMEKKEILNRITSADMINPIIEELKIRYQRKGDERSIIESEVNKLLSKKELLEEQRREMLANDDTDERLRELDNDEKESMKFLIEIEKDIKSLKEKSKAKTNEIANIKIDDVSTLKKKYKEYQSDCDEIEKALLENKRVERKLKSELEDTITCPNCNHEFIHESELELSVEEVKALIEETRKEIAKQEKDLALKNNNLKSIQQKIEEAREKEEYLENLKEENRILEKKIKRREEEKNDEELKILKIQEAKEELKNRKRDNKMLNNLNQRIIDFDEELKKMNERLLPINKEIEIIKFWQFYMGKSGFQTFLANKTIKILEGTTNYFLEKMKIDYRVNITPFTVLKSEEVREKIDCFISDNGIDLKNFLAYSGGERQRVTLAGILAIQKLINISLNGKGLNMLLLDESLGNIDSMGTMEIVNILEKIGITVMLITQNIEDSSIFQNSLQVIKRAGVSMFV